MIPPGSRRGDIKLASQTRPRLVALAALSLVAGTATGLLAAVFRLALVRADRLRGAAVAWLQPYGGLGLMGTVALCALTAGVAAWLVRRYSPHATGSGIPHVESQ